MDPKNRQHKHLLDVLQGRILKNNPEFQRYRHSTNLKLDEEQLVDYLVVLPGERPSPDQLFGRLRFGGQVLFLSTNPTDIDRWLKPFRRLKEFKIENDRTEFSDGVIPGFKKAYHHAAVRKVRLIRSGEFSDRFTYHVELVHDPNNPGQYLVMKGVPSTSQMIQRLEMRYPDMDPVDVERRARSFTHDIFPLFLTREAGMLKVLRKYLPEEFRPRVPETVNVQKNDRGYVTRFTMTWMRNGHTAEGRRLGHMEFARQLSGLLTVLHEKAQIIHLDLRPDNLVITPDGVGFIDFGSSIRVDEDISRSKTLMKMFDQVMTTSGVQKMLGRMCDNGEVTSRVICDGHRKIDKVVDLFFMVLQMNNPHANPDLKDLVDFDPESVEARAIRQLTDRVLKPKDPKRPELQTAADVYRALGEITSRHSNSVWKTTVGVVN